MEEYISNHKNIFVSIVDKPDYINKVNCSDGTIYPCIVSVGNNKFYIGNITDGINKNNIDKILSYSKK